MRDREIVGRSISRDNPERRAGIDPNKASLLAMNVVEASPYGMLVIDQSGTIAFANRQIVQLFGYDKSELLGARVESLMPARYSALHEAHRRAYHQDPSLRPMGRGRDLVGRRKDGSEFPVEIALNVFNWNDSRMTLAAVTDISIRKRLELELHQSNERLEEFTHVVSHDLKSPLRGISDLIEWIAEDLDDQITPKILHNFERIHVRLKRVNGIIDDLRIYARAGRASSDLVNIDPRALIEGVLDLQPVPEDFEVEIQVDARSFLAARTPLETVLRNLLGNAIKHHDRSRGHIAMTLKEDGSDCLFTVADDGPGIPTHEQEQVFSLFHTASRSLQKGSGIGLSLAKRLIESHGGRIEVESVDGRRGTTFRFWWPRLEKEGPP